MILKEMLNYCFGGAVVCLTQDTYKDEKAARRLVLLYLPDRQKMTVGVLRTLADKEVVSLGATGLAEDPAWKKRDQHDGDGKAAGTGRRGSADRRIAGRKLGRNRRI